MSTYVDRTAVFESLHEHRNIFWELREQGLISESTYVRSIAQLNADAAFASDVLADLAKLPSTRLA
jgi:hypothetical protein